MTITVFVGDCNEELAKQATHHSANAYLVDHSNFENFLLSVDATENITVYTSMADLPKITKSRSVFYEVLNVADLIYYRPPTKWSDHSDDFVLYSSKIQTEYFLYLLNRLKNNVKGLELLNYTDTPYLKLNSARQSDQPCLWVTGCSITNGVGVKKSQCFANLIATQYFDSKYIDLSKGGSSLEFQADQLLRSDIRQNDTVLWGLTSEYRAVTWNRATGSSDTIRAHNFDYRKTNIADDITDETRLYKGLVLTSQVSNFCQKIGAKLVMIPMLSSEHLQLLLHSNPCYYQLPYMTQPIDYGSDNIHPGPKQHQLYADQIGKILEGIL